MQRPDIGIVGDELVVGVDPGVVQIVFEQVGHDQVHGCHLDQDVAAAGHNPSVRRHDHGVQIVGLDRDLRARHPLQRGRRVLVDVGQAMAYDLEGDG